MAIDCTGCKNKMNSMSQGYCTHFAMAPQLDSCELHSEKQAATNAAEPSGSYIWLGEVRSIDGITHMSI
jgi:hypothetical protein